MNDLLLCLVLIPVWIFLTILNKWINKEDDNEN